MNIFVARQPIFDVHNRLFGYELLYRGDATLNAAVGASADQMASQVIIHSFVDIGLAQITGGTLGFLNCSQDTLTGGYVELLGPESLVVELLETVEPEPAVIAACERLHAGGYTLALDDFEYDPRFEPLLRLASIIKLDVLDRTPEQIERVLAPLRTYGATLLAERVEDAAMHETCRALGFELFQGYHFSRPEILTRRDLSAVHATVLRLINLLRDESASDAQVEAAFRSDVALSYKLLRIVNSAAVGGSGVESILHAIRLIGRTALSRWVALLLVASLGSAGGPNRELALAAMWRAHFCEALARLAGRQAHAGAHFMVGVFSLLDVLTGSPMAEILGRVDLSTDVKNALLQRAGPHAAALTLVEAYDAGDWEGVAAAARELDVPVAELPSLYLRSLTWAQERLREADDA